MLLLLSGHVQMTTPYQSSALVGEEAAEERRRMRAAGTLGNAQSSTITLTRGPGVYGEISFVHSIATGQEQTSRANITVSKGSSYLIWEGADLRAASQSDRALGNALVAYLSGSMSMKLYDTTRSAHCMGQSLNETQTELDIAHYERDVRLRAREKPEPRVFCAAARRRHYTPPNTARRLGVTLTARAMACTYVCARRLSTWCWTRCAMRCASSTTAFRAASMGTPSAGRAGRRIRARAPSCIVTWRSCVRFMMRASPCMRRCSPSSASSCPATT